MADVKNLGAFFPTTQIWDLPNLSSMDTNSPAFKDLLVNLYKNMNSVAMLLNIKDTGQYSPLEFICGQQYAFGDKPKQIFRKVINCGALLNTAPKSTAHGITPNAGFVFTRIYGAATDPANLLYLPLPYASPTLVNNIELSVNDTFVIITTGSNRTAYTKSYVVVEYFKFD